MNKKWIRQLPNFKLRLYGHINPTYQDYGMEIDITKTEQGFKVLGECMYFNHNMTDSFSDFRLEKSVQFSKLSELYEHYEKCFDEFLEYQLKQDLEEPDNKELIERYQSNYKIEDISKKYEVIDEPILKITDFWINEDGEKVELESEIWHSDYSGGGYILKWWISEEHEYEDLYEGIEHYSDLEITQGDGWDEIYTAYEKEINKIPEFLNTPDAWGE